MIIFGWTRRFTVLGMKLDECANCGSVCEHFVGRKTNWGHVFWIPVLFLGFHHGMICSTCGTWTSIPWNSVRMAMKSGRLPLERPRPNAAAGITATSAVDMPTADQAPAAAVVAATEAIRIDAPESVLALARQDMVAGTSGPIDFDQFLLNPKRGPWDLYLKAWPVLVALVLASSALAPHPTAASPSGGSPATQAAEGPAHTCWLATDDSITGCKLADGSLMGYTTQSQTTCYFEEPIAEEATSLSCDH